MLISSTFPPANCFPFALIFPLLGTPTSKASEVYNRTVKNPFFWALVLGSASTGAVAASTFLLPPMGAAAISLTTLSLLGVRGMTLSNNQKKWILSELSLWGSTILAQCPLCLRRPWYSEITSHITLGAAPLKSREHFEVIQQTHQSVLSMIEDFEHDPHLLGVPVTSQDWNEAGIGFLNLPNLDRHPVKLEDVQRGVEWMHAQISQNKKVYVHCLAGVGRSATVVVCYLIKYSGYTPEQAVLFVNSKRRIVVSENSPAIVAFVAHGNRYCTSK